MINLYETLGVSEDASQEEIKKAYKKKAMILHPDRAGGNNKQFTDLKRAYEVLSDRNSRDHYDETGEVENHDKSEDVIRSELVKLFTMILDTEAEIDHVDVIDLGMKVIIKNIAAVKGEIKKLEGFIKHTNKAKNRMKIKDGKANIFELIIESRMNEINRNIAKLEDVIKIHEKIKVELKDYEYSFDVREEMPLNGFFRVDMNGGYSTGA